MLLPGGIMQGFVGEGASGLSHDVGGRDLVLESWGREDSQVGQP